MIELLHLNSVDSAAAHAIIRAGGAIEHHCKCCEPDCDCSEEDRTRYCQVKIPVVLDRRDLDGDGRLCEDFLQDETEPSGFRFVPLYRLPGGQWIKNEPYDEDRRTVSHRRRLVLCELETELAAWVRRREQLRAADGHPRLDWEVGLAPPPWGGVHTPGINPQITRDSTNTPT
jgi:hypothetical protein